MCFAVQTVTKQNVLQFWLLSKTPLCETCDDFSVLSRFYHHYVNRAYQHFSTSFVTGGKKKEVKKEKKPQTMQVPLCRCKYFWMHFIFLINSATQWAAKISQVGCFISILLSRCVSRHTKTGSLPVVFVSVLRVCASQSAPPPWLYHAQ